MSALLLTKGLTATSHSGLRTLFHQHLIRPGLLPLGQGPLYDRLFDQRQRGDYADLVHFGVDEVRAWSVEVQAFVDAVAVLIPAGSRGAPPLTELRALLPLPGMRRSLWTCCITSVINFREAHSCRGDVRRDDLGQVKIALPYQDHYRVFAYLHASCVSTPGKPDWGVVWRLEDFLQPPGYALDEMADLCAYVREQWLPAGFAPTPARPPTPKAG